MPYKNPEKQRAYVRSRRMYLKRRARNRAISERAKDVSCADCKEKYPPYVMDFDHVKGEKIRDVAWFVGQGTVEQLLTEIAKCDVICANCHRIRTWADSYKTSEQMLTTWRECKPLSQQSG